MVRAQNRATPDGAKFFSSSAAEHTSPKDKKPPICVRILFNALGTVRHNLGPRGHRPRFRNGITQVSEGDPTDHALAAIASIVDKGETSDDRNAGDAPEAESAEQPEFRLAQEILATPPDAPNPPPSVSPDADNYTKFGPGPLAAIRFKWTARRDDSGGYFVEETIGENSHPIVSGPMTREAAISFVDDRERDARRRFEALRSEMAGGEIGPSADDQPPRLPEPAG